MAIQLSIQKPRVENRQGIYSSILSWGKHIDNWFNRSLRIPLERAKSRPLTNVMRNKGRSPMQIVGTFQLA